MNPISMKCGQLKRALKLGRPLRGVLLNFALDTLPDESDGSAHDELMMGVRKKILAEEQLSDYEYHVFVEVVLLHVRLAAGATYKSIRFTASELKNAVQALRVACAQTEQDATRQSDPAIRAGCDSSAQTLRELTEKFEGALGWHDTGAREQAR